MRAEKHLMSCIVLVVASFLALSTLSVAQQASVKARITQAVSETNLTVLRGNTHPLARPEFDRGLAPVDLPLNRMLLVLKRSPEQETALKSLLEGLQDRSSVNYHSWLSPEQFGQQFGPADQDIQKIRSWLESHGLQVNKVAKGRMTVEFSGTAEQLKEAFHTEIHRYEVNGEEHWANSTNPAIPTALTPVVAGLASLHNFARKPLHHIPGVISQEKETGRYQLLHSSSANPLWSAGRGCGLTGGICYIVSPQDLATIYNISPLWKASLPIDGTGQTIAIVSESDIYPQDFSDFRADFGIPPGTLIMTIDGPDPFKLPTTGDEIESDLDVQWSGSVAPGAIINLVISGSTNTTQGVDLSANYIVDNNVAPILSESYGACELDMGTAGNQFYNQLWQQAAAEGITVFVATGDSGAAVCDRSSPTPTHGLAVNGISSTPYNVAVGGTDFDDLQNPSSYWNSNNTNYQESALGYIPETTWNDTCTNAEFFSYTGETNAESDCNDSSSVFWPNFLVAVGGSGGASNCITSSDQSLSTCSGGYAKPDWQTGPGVPIDGARDVPDVAMFAADGLNANFYVACMTDIYLGCAGGAGGTLIPIGGTSASTPIFAGIMALINQKTGSRQGNANYVFYPLAAQSGASCDSSVTHGGSCIFEDVSKGTIATPCVSGSPNCVTNTTGDQNGVLSGYAATAGYDLATGLGSVNVANLVNNWGSVSFRPTISTLSLNPTVQITHGSPVNVSLTVAPKTGSGVPSGMASLLTSKGEPGGTFTLTDGAFSGTTSLLPGGSYTVTAHYAGDGTYGASDSTPGIPFTVSAEPSTTTMQLFTLDQSGNAVPYTTGFYGYTPIYVRANVAGQSAQGVPTGIVNFTQTPSVPTNFRFNPYDLNGEGNAMVPLPEYYYLAYTPGTYSINASYSGDSSFKPSNAVASFSVSQAPTTTVISDLFPCTLEVGPCSINSGDTVMIIASINSAGEEFGSPPTGTITFYSNGAPLGPPAAVASDIIPPNAFINTSSLPLGPNNITAQYNGDSNYTGSISASMSILVGGTFALAANPTMINVASPGQSGSTTLTFTSQYGLTGTATLSPAMCSSLPTASYCNFSPGTVTFTSSTTSVPITLTILTTGPSAASASRQPLLPPPAPTSSEILAFLLGGILVIAVNPKRELGRIALLAVLVASVSTTSCGGGSAGGSGGGGGGGTGGTPAGNYQGVTVTVTINGVTQTINNLSVNVK